MAEHAQQGTGQRTEKKLSGATDRGQFVKSDELTVLSVLTLTAGAGPREVAGDSVRILTRCGATSLNHDTVVPQLAAMAWCARRSRANGGRGREQTDALRRIRETILARRAAPAAAVAVKQE